MIFKYVSFIFILNSIMIFSQDSNTVTYGSNIKLVHKDSNHLLHSHSIAWGSGSGQQSVTATATLSDPNSLWVVKEPVKGSDNIELATPIKCGSIISLEHAGTGKNLHSHLFKAPLSGNQEVSGFSESDTGDNWIVECDSKDKYWQRGHLVSLKHADTAKYLSTAEIFKFNTQNCGHQCPIMGQTEVSAANKKDSRAYWLTGQGVYFAPKLELDDEL